MARSVNPARQHEASERFYFIEPTEHVGVIGSAFRTTEVFVNHGHILRETPAKLRRKFLRPSMLDEQRDSLGPMQNNVAISANNATHVVKNSSRAPEAYVVHDASKLQTEVQSKGGVSLLMRRREARALYTTHLASARALKA